MSKSAIKMIKEGSNLPVGKFINLAPEYQAKMEPEFQVIQDNSPDR
jgi:hypothetical protein